MKNREAELIRRFSGGREIDDVRLREEVFTSVTNLRMAEPTERVRLARTVLALCRFQAAWERACSKPGPLARLAPQTQILFDLVKGPLFSADEERALRLDIDEFTREDARWVRDPIKSITYRAHVRKVPPPRSYLATEAAWCGDLDEERLAREVMTRENVEYVRRRWQEPHTRHPKRGRPWKSKGR
jgi:hypothetical protein